MIVQDWDYQLNEDHAKHKLVHDTRNTVLGVNVQKAALVVRKVDQEDVMHQEKQAKLIARIWDQTPNHENVKHNPAQLMEDGENGRHGRAAANHAGTDRRRSHVCATVLRQRSVDEDVPDTKSFMLHATSNHVQSMVNGLHSVPGCPAASHAEVVSKRRFENVQTHLQNMKANHALELLLQSKTATLIIVPSMEGGRNGVCGESAAKPAAEGEHIECDNVETHLPNTGETVVLVHRSKRNNVEPSSAQSMATGTHSVLMRLAANPVVVEFKSAEGIVTTQFQSTTEKAAVEVRLEARHVTQIHVPSMVSIHNGQNFLLVHSHVEEECKVANVNVHHLNMEVSHARY